MVSQQYKNVVFAFFMSLIMSGVMSLVISIFNTDFSENEAVESIFTIWLQAWLFSFIIALPTILAISPFVVWLVSLVIKPEQS